MAKPAVSPDKFSTFGELLKYLRKREEMTQRELAIQVGYSDTQISRPEQNQRMPDAATLKALFVPALHIEREPQWVDRLLELARQARLGELPEPGKIAAPNNLPASLTTFVGREKEQTEILQLLAAHRLVTLTGSGGVGKTRISLKVGGQVLDHFADGVWLTELAPLNDPELVAQTVALGMGFDKPDIGFVIHFQRPGSVVAYYQQVGRAGRAVDRAYGILLSGAEDDEIQDYFIDSAFPSVEIMNQILAALEKNEGLPLYDILARVNVSRSMLDKALKLLEVDGAIGAAFENHRTIYFRTPNPWHPDTERIEHVTRQRRAEQTQMQSYMSHAGCLMEFLQCALDDPHPQTCGCCANCRGKGLPSTVSRDLVIEAEKYLKGASIPIAPRLMLPAGIFPDYKRRIQPELLNEPGRSLCYYGDAGWGTLVRASKYEQNYFSDELVEAAAHLICERWKPEPFPVWTTAIPSLRHPMLVRRFAERLSNRLGIPFKPVLARLSDAPQQKTMQNSSMQARNVINTLSISDDVPNTPVLLVDDILDSGWILTMAGWLLRIHNSGPVYPFTLAQATARNT